MVKATIFEAKTKLSELVRKAQSGEKVVITSGREKIPVARLEPIKARNAQRLGFMKTPGFELNEAFWEPLPEDELRLWNGDGE